MKRTEVPAASSAEDTAEAFARKDPYWPAQLTVLATIALDLDLPNKLTLHRGSCRHSRDCCWSGWS
jgi:hypothetical protein